MLRAVDPLPAAQECLLNEAAILRRSLRGGVPRLDEELETGYGQDVEGVGSGGPQGQAGRMPTSRWKEPPNTRWMLGHSRFRATTVPARPNRDEGSRLQQ